MWPPSGNGILAIIEGWPNLRGFVLSNILNGDAIGIKLSDHSKEGGHYEGFHCMSTYYTVIYLMQVNPLYDKNGGTALMAATILFEMLCVLPGVKYLDFSGANKNTFQF